MTAWTSSLPNQKRTIQQCPQTLLRLVRRFLAAMTPTLLRADGAVNPALTATSWMDGMRGICAVIVVNFHFLFTFSPLAVTGYGAGPPGHASYNIAALPPFCLLWDGASSVNIFFTISGFVCSYKALKLMHRAQDSSSQGAVLNSLSASAFRRAFRLFLPVIAMTLMTTLLAYVGGFALTEKMFAEPKKWFPTGVSAEVSPPHFSGLLPQLSSWAQELLALINIWAPKAVFPKHDPHLWTIGFEYRTSMHLYTALLMLARCRPYIRLAALCGLALIYASWHHWEGPLFFLGAAAAQWDVIRRANSSSPEHQSLLLEDSSSKGEHLPEYSSPAGQSSPPRQRHALRAIGICIAIYFIAFPVANLKYPAVGYQWLNAWIPTWYKWREVKFPKSIGTTLLLYLLSEEFATSHQSRWRTVLESRIALYLGKIMFSLYLVHGPVQHAVGYAIPHWVWHTIGGSREPWQWALGLLVGWSVSLVLSLWCADVFHREVEVRCVRLQGWIETWCTTATK